jgi:hypothetical protein
VWVPLGLAVEGSAGYHLRLRPIEALVAGAVITGILAGRSASGKGRKVLIVAGAVATLWSAAVWLFDLRPVLVVILVAGGGVAAPWWWMRQRTHSRIRVIEHPVRLLPEWGWWRNRLAGLRHLDRERVGWLLADMAGVIWPMALAWWREHAYRRRGRRTLRGIQNDWRRTAADASVPGCRIRTAEWDPVGSTIELDLRRGQTHGQMQEHYEALGSALGANRGTLRIRGQQPGQPMNRATLRWVHDDPLAGPGVLWPFMDAPEVDSILEPISLGPDEMGEPVRLHLADSEDTLVIGIKGAGKSALLSVIVAGVAGMRDAVLWGIDPAAGVEFEPWRSVFDRLAYNADGTMAMLLALERVVHARLAVLRRYGVRSWDPRYGPFIVVLIDELLQLSPAMRKRLTLIVALCRKAGVRIVVATQHPAKADIGSTMRSQLGRVICMRVEDDEAVRMAFGSNSGLRPQDLTLAGSFLLEDPRHKDPMPARGYLIRDEVVPTIAERLAPGRPALDEESAVAVRGGPARVIPLRPGDTPVADIAPEAEIEAEEDARLVAVQAVLSGAGKPLSARAIAKAHPALTRWWVREKGLPALRERGVVVETPEKCWTLTPAATQTAAWAREWS